MVRKGQLLKTRLSEAQILAWADAHYKRTGQWPTLRSGRVVGARGEYWNRLDNDLRLGHRGLRAGSSLLRLLARHRGATKEGTKPKLTTTQVLAWADAHYKRTRRWPRQASGRVVGAKGETWEGIGSALRFGIRGFRGGITLLQFLKKHRGASDESRGFPLNKKRLLAYCDEYHRIHAKWPSVARQDPVPGAPWETWSRIDAALTVGLRGMPGGTTLARFLRDHRDMRYRMALPKLTVRVILAWADSHHRRTGHWPIIASGPIVDAAGETWSGINSALWVGRRGLPGGDSLYKVLLRRRGVRRYNRNPRRDSRRLRKRSSD